MACEALLQHGLHEVHAHAAANADWKSVPGYGLMLTDQPGEGSWPITAASFILMHIVPQDAAASAAALKFFDWAYKNGDQMAEELDYIPNARQRRRPFGGGVGQDQGLVGQARVCDAMKVCDRTRRVDCGSILRFGSAKRDLCKNPVVLRGTRRSEAFHHFALPRPSS